MRLIDIESEMLIKKLEISKFEGGLSAKQAIRLFMNQPTVEAIPIEWIENYAKENYPIWDRHAPIRAFYTNMIKVWRKENDSNNI